ncbi:hypothetical protein J2P12_06630, partial [Candidatus Bathyarchaeota archaeon]|nr:hypothetical protein [Candidatus Bathyarchaeota archaeon]
MGTEAPVIPKQGWVRAHIAILLIAIAVIAAGVGGATYYINYVASCQANSNIKFYENLAQSEKSFFENILIPQFHSIYPNTTVTLVNLPSASDEANDVKALVQGNCVGSTLVGIDNLAVGELTYSNSVMNLTSIIGSIEPTNLIPSAVNLISYEQKIYN